MPIYEKSTKALMHDFATAELTQGQEFAPQDAIKWFQERYPKIKSNTVAMHVEGMSVNSSTRRHHKSIRPGSGHDLFFKIGRGRHRLWNPDRDPPADHPNVSDDPKEELEVSVANDIDDDDQSGKEFAFERDLRNYLARNIGALESGLRLYVDEDGDFNGVEFPVGGRFIDILAVDANNDFVVVELKVSRGHERTVGQLLRYMGWIRKNLAADRKTRGMIVASNFSEDLRLAASLIPDVTLVEYQMSLKFRSLPRP